MITLEDCIGLCGLTEQEVLAWCARNETSGLPCKSLLPHSRLAEVLVDKGKMTDLLAASGLVPPSMAFSRNETDFERLFDVLGDDFWVRSSSGTSGLGSLRVDSKATLMNWMQINPDVTDFLASKYLAGRNLACKLLYYDGALLRAATAERVEYIMAKVAPSGITGNTSFGRLLNEPELVSVAVRAMDIIFEAVDVKKHGFFTVDFKEDMDGRPYLTEVNVRHVAFTQCFAAGGANFAADTIDLLRGTSDFDRNFKIYEFEKDLIFLRDVDVIPVLMKETELLKDYKRLTL
jgi:carbamoyl-phosphate synthase large subunit